MSKLFQYTGSYTDLYQLTMSEVYFRQGRERDKVVFDYLFRKLPFNGGYVVFAGLHDLLFELENVTFTDAELIYLERQGFDQRFLIYLSNFRFSGGIFSMREGDIAFPGETILQVEGNIIEAQLIETLLLNLLNFQSLIATKASRMKAVAGSCQLVDFGLRRAHGPGGYYASRAAIVGGFDATSNVKAGMDYDIPVSGTMAHSFVQSYDNELEAFRHYAEVHKDNCVLLVDTYNTLLSGIPNAITIATELDKQGYRLKGIRLDSGDLAYLAKESRKILDQAGFGDVKIVTSNQLDEYVIKSLLEQGAPIDVFGVGTSLVTGQADGALDGVYKMSFCNGEPRIKLSENVNKVTLPHKKQTFRIWDDGGIFRGADVVALHNESDPVMMHHLHNIYKSMDLSGFEKEPLLQKVMENGEKIPEAPLLADLRAFCLSRLEQLPKAFKRFENPHQYKVGISELLRDERNKLIEKYNQ